MWCDSVLTVTVCINSVANHACSLPLWSLRGAPCCSLQDPAVGHWPLCSPAAGWFWARVFPPFSFFLLFPFLNYFFPLLILSLCVSFSVYYTVSQSFPVWPFIYLPLSVPYLALPFSFSFFLSLLGLNAFSWLLSSCLPGAVYDIDWFTQASTGAESFFFLFLSPWLRFSVISVWIQYFRISQAKSQNLLLM